MQGMHELAEDNWHIGHLDIVLDEDLSMSKAGRIIIQVTVNVDENHKLTVTAVDKKSGTSARMQQDFTVQGYTPDEIRSSNIKV